MAFLITGLVLVVLMLASALGQPSSQPDPIIVTSLSSRRNSGAVSALLIIVVFMALMLIATLGSAAGN